MADAAGGRARGHGGGRGHGGQRDLPHLKSKRSKMYVQYVCMYGFIRKLIVIQVFGS